jgi:hypothetical protein
VGRRGACHLLDDMGLIEKHTGSVGCGAEHGLEQMPAPTTYIGDRIEGREIIAR